MKTGYSATYGLRPQWRGPEISSLSPSHRVARILMGVFLACFTVSTVLAGSLQEGLATQAGKDFGGWYRPIGDWTGQMILPEPSQRKADGSVHFLVYSSLRPELQGKFLRLAWDGSRPEDQWFDRARPDVRFDPARVRKAQKNGAKLPSRLDGWPRVSPLESLPANRSEGTIEVLLKDPVYRDGTLYIRSEPVQINGSQMALVTFKGPAEDNLRRVVHFNPATRAFDGPEEIVQMMRDRIREGENFRSTSTVAIEESPLNNYGWYVYGKRIRGMFLIKALEPRPVQALAPGRVLRGTARAKEYFSGPWLEGLQPGLVRQTTFEPGPGSTSPADSGLSAEAGAIDRVWPIGTRGLVIHMFGWRKVAGAPATPLDLLGLVTGHFAFGVAEVVRDQFTGENRFDIEYKQVYAHNREEVVSGSIKWHAYMGNLRRGWMYSIPVIDTVIRLPELDPFDFGGWRIDPLEGLSRELERMMALYRVGGGTGIAEVRPDVSCVQDSHNALHSGLQVFCDAVAKDPRVKAWSGSPAVPASEKGRFRSLEELARRVEKTITIFGIPQQNWKSFARDPLGTRDPAAAKPLVDGLLSIRTVFPRGAYDHLLALALSLNHPLLNILTVQIGGRVPGLIPMKPTSPFHK